MAGHSKFKNIMHRKGAQDKKRAKIFSKHSKEITVATKLGSPDPQMNPRLRLAIAAAKADNMPKDNIDRAIKKGSDPADTSQYEEIRYEGYGDSGVAFIVEALTDNRNRTASDIRTAFTKSKGNLGESNSVSFMFDRLGQIIYPANIASEEDFYDQAILMGAEDVIFHADMYEIMCQADQLHKIYEICEKKYGAANNVQLIWKPQNFVKIQEEPAKNIMKLVDLLEDHDDVQNIYANYDIDEALLSKLMAD